jgi:hypothetical protein
VVGEAEKCAGTLRVQGAELAGMKLARWKILASVTTRRGFRVKCIRGRDDGFIYTLIRTKILTVGPMGMEYT